MSTNENKTQETTADVTAFLDAVADPVQRADAFALVALMREVTGHPPRLWGPSIVGFGRYHYRYDSGREGDSLRVGFSPRKGATTVYLVPGVEDFGEPLSRLGKHKVGKGCLYLKRLSDVDVNVLRELVTRAVAVMAERYPE